MNADRPSPSGTEPYRSLQILDELSNNDSLTQRELSSSLGIALGLVNSYIKNLIKKGSITVKAIPSKRYTYYLTPTGFAEKTRLTYDLLHDYTRIYREARKNLKRLFHELEKKGAKKIIFAGADEIAEIAYLTLQETTMKLAGVADNDKAGELFFSLTINPINDAVTIDHDIIVITSYVNRTTIYQALIDINIDRARIHMLFAEKT